MQTQRHFFQPSRNVLRADVIAKVGCHPKKRKTDAENLVALVAPFLTLLGAVVAIAAPGASLAGRFRAHFAKRSR
jgi:hypothetical protein